jgi:dTDP-glucose 4,6-dehydratase
MAGTAARNELLVKTIIVTGGAGFIGSALVRQLIDETDARVVNVDALTYAGNLDAVGAARHSDRHVFERVDLRDRAALDRVFSAHRPTAVMHLAAETHVDRSIKDPAVFVGTNVDGTLNVLEAARRQREELDAEGRRRFRLVHVSTDEVYGDLGPSDTPLAEGAPYKPSSPYAASKASADHLVRAWHRTFGLPAVIATCCNNYGPWQYPEKLIPLVVLNALAGKPLPLYGTGENVRDWLFVEDHARALRLLLEGGEPGRTYHIAAGEERTNLDVVAAVCALLDDMAPRPGRSYNELIRFVADRPGHDRRYALNDDRLRNELGWRPRERFETGLRTTVRWYLDHPDWVGSIRAGEYRRWMATQYQGEAGG